MSAKKLPKAKKKMPLRDPDTGKFISKKEAERIAAAENTTEPTLTNKPSTKFVPGETVPLSGSSNSPKISKNPSTKKVSKRAVGKSEVERRYSSAPTTKAGDADPVPSASQKGKGYSNTKKPNTYRKSEIKQEVGGEITYFDGTKLPT